MQRVLSVVAAGLLAVTASAQLSVVIPNGMATAEGSTSNAFPWGRGGTGLRIQTIYDSSHFTAQGINAPIIITGLRWRPNTGVALVASSYTAGCTVKLSTSPLDQAAASTTMASNQGADLTTCYSGVVSWGAQAAQTGPTPFGIVVPFTSNFLYDPNLGDLNIECDLPVQTFTGTGPQLDVHGTSPLACRVYISTGYPGTGVGTINANHGVVVQVDYVPAAGLFAGFNANVTSGASPLTVNFTSSSYTNDPGGITSYAWDFDGDSIIDSTVQNPTWVYPGCGTFNVSLTVTDSSHPASTLTRSGYIRTDNITANFTTQVIGPNTVQFTDTSSMPATAWAWDFDGDSVIDSTAQNPVWAFPNSNAANVAFTATRFCNSNTVIKSVVPLQVLAHNTLPNNGLSSGAMVFFDLSVLNPRGVEIGSFDIFGSVANTAYTLDVWVKQGSYLTFEKTPAAWMKVGTGTGTSGATTTTASNTTMLSPIYLPPGNYGMAMQYTGVGPRYQTGTGLTTVANGDLSMTLGASLSTAVGSPFVTTSAPTTPRWWSGTIYYGTHNINASAGYGLFGQGCPGTAGLSSLTGISPPVVGNSLNVAVNNLPLSVAIMATGFSNTTSSSGPLPLDLGILGAPGCSARVSPDVTTLLFGAAGSANYTLNIPNAPAFSGVMLYQQAFVLDSAANALGATLSNAAAMVLGY